MVTTAATTASPAEWRERERAGFSDKPVNEDLVQIKLRSRHAYAIARVRMSDGHSGGALDLGQ